MFIETEIRALQNYGHEVVAYSVRPPDFRLSQFGEPRAILKTSGLRLVALAPGAVVGRPRAAMLMASQILRELRYRGVSIPRMTKLLGYTVEALLLARQLRRDSIEHLHVHFANNAADIALFWATTSTRDKRATRSWSISVHGPSDFQEPREHGLAAKLDSAAFVRTISNFAAEQLKAIVGDEVGDKLHIVRMGITMPSPPATLRRPATSSLNVLFVGRLVAEKNPDVLIRACVALAERRPSFQLRLHVVGDGPLGSQLKQEAAGIQRENLEIIFLGALRNWEVQAEYESAHVVCLPSSSEGLPVVLMEAMAQGVAVVSTPVAAIPELITHGVTGVLVAPGSVGELTNALARLLDDEDYRRTIAEAGLMQVAQIHNVVHTSRTLAELFEKQ